MTPEALTRTFPFTVRPGHRETLDSYTRRTLAANYESSTLPDELLKLADDGRSWATILAAKVRRNLDRLTNPTGHPSHGADACSRCDSLLSERWACLLCSRGEHIQQHPHLDAFLCERHHRWTGPGTTPNTQPAVTAADVSAHRLFRTLRRQGRIDTPLLRGLIDSLAEDLDTTHAHAFAPAIKILQWLTRTDTLRRMFDPAQPYPITFTWLSDTVSNLAGTPAPESSRTIWLRLWPTQVALHSAFRGYRGYHAGHPHDFTLPRDITTWYDHPDALQSQRDYLACTGDTALSTPRPRRTEPTVLTPHTHHTICAKGHRYLEVVLAAATTIERERTACPVCTGFHVQVGINDLASIAPAIAAQLHPTLNGDLRATGITARSSRSVWWECPQGHPYQATPSNRTLTDTGCSVCLGRVILRGVNDLATTHPFIAQELHPRNHKRAHEITASDTKKRTWLCPEGHDYAATTKKRVTTRGTCPECQKRRRHSSGRNLTTTHPDLSRTWRPELNEGRAPQDYTKGSKLTVTWWCEDGQHPFDMRIEARTRGCGCPYCARRLVLEGFNDFASTHSNLAGDWHHYRNRKRATEVMAGSNTKYHWKCTNGHDTTQSIPHRIKSGGCTQCPRHERPGNKPLSYQAFFPLPQMRHPA